MKNALFNCVSHCNLLILKIIRSLGDFLIIANGRIGWLVLSLIDKKRLSHAEAATEQESEISELSVLFGITAVRNDAMTKGMWNEDHQDTLNFLGNLLANEHDWEVEQVERYLYEVIETGPAVSKEE